MFIIESTASRPETMSFVQPAPETEYLDFWRKNMKKITKHLTLILAVSLFGSAFAGCSQKGTDSVSSTASTGDSSSSAAEESSFAGYPVQTDKTLTIWSFQSRPQKDYADQYESPFHTNLIKNTGINLEWEWPVEGSDERQSYNLMIASGDLPDIIFYYLDGQSLIDDQYIIPLNDVLNQYAPNLSGYIEEHPELEKALKTDAGNYYMFPWLRDSDMLRSFTGYVVRKDWLDEQNLDIPVTLDDWTVMLKSFKENYGATFSAYNARMPEMGFWNAYGVTKSFYLDDDGKIQYGPIQEGYKEGLKLMHEWYEAGYIDPDLSTMDDTGVQTKVLNDKVAASFTSGVQIGNWGTNIKSANSSAVWAAAPYPVLNEGDPIEFIQMENMPYNLGAAITTACKDVELAARFLDYGYSEEGRLFWNFGAEGESYTMENGEPTFTDEVMNYAGGVDSALTKYMGTQGAGMSIQDTRMWTQKSSPLAVEAVKLWTSENNMKKHIIPYLTPTTEESTDMTSLLNAIQTYVDEMYFKFLLGEESLDNFDQYVETIQSMQIEHVLELKTAQLERYNNR